jgi:ribosomal protein L18
VFRSLSHIYVQLIDDAEGKTVVSASTSEKALRDGVAASVPATADKAPAEKAAAEKAPSEKASAEKPAKGEKGEKKGAKKAPAAAPVKASGSNVAGAKLIGKVIAERAQKKGIKQIVFDRGGYIYHGRVKALADAAREAGLEF